MSGNQKKYSSEFKIRVTADMREHRLSYHEAVRKHWGTKTHSEDCKYIKIVKRRKRIFLEEGAEGLGQERRGKSYGSIGLVYINTAPISSERRKSE